MSFLEPLFLWALPLMTVPFILHLIHKRPPKPMPFSHINWLKQAHQATVPRKKLKELLLLIVRTLLILMLIVLFARPMIQGGRFFSGKSQEETIVMLFDVSASMGAVIGGRPVMDLAKEEAQSALRKLPAGVRTGLIVYSDHVEQEIAPTDERSRLLSAISALSAQPRPTQIFPALQQGYRILANQPKGRKSLLVVSDQAKSGWTEAMEQGGRWEAFDPQARVILWSPPKIPSNSGVADFSLQLSEEGTLKGFWTAARSGAVSSAVNWRLELGQRVVGQGSLAAQKGKSEDVPLQAQLPEGGFYSGQLSLTADALPFDDVYYVAGRVPKGFNLVIVEGESGLAPSESESYYARMALESPRDPRLESVRTIRPEEVSAAALANADVVLLANTGSANLKADELRSWVEKGGGLLISAGNKWPKAPETPLGYFRAKPKSSSVQTIVPPDADTAFLSRIAGLQTFQWDQIEVSQHMPLEPDSASSFLLQLKNGDPLLVRKQIGQGDVLMLTTSIDRDWTNLPAKPAYAPLLRELIASLADPLRAQSTLMGTVGEPLKIQAPAGVKSVTVINPDGTSAGALIDRDGNLTMPAPTKAGLYRVRTDKQEDSFSFAVNMKNLKDEGDITRLGSSDLKVIFPKAPVEWVEAEGTAKGNLFTALQGRDIGQGLLWFLFFLFAVETILGSTALFRRKVAVATGVLMLFAFHPSTSASDANLFRWAQLKHNGAWDPYPNVHERIFQMVQSMTNIPVTMDRKVIRLEDPALFENPFLMIKGNSALQLSKEEKLRLKQYIDRGGFVYFDDTLADSRGPFGASVRSLMAEFYPERSFTRLPIDHALFRSFFLLRNVAGRRISEKYLEGIDVGGGLGGEGRTAVVYCPNDLLGAWMKDNLGQYTFTCEPGGETQRWESFKLTINIIMFSVTGTYKKDAVHQPFIEQKLGS